MPSPQQAKQPAHGATDPWSLWACGTCVVNRAQLRVLEARQESGLSTPGGSQDLLLPTCPRVTPALGAGCVCRGGGSGPAHLRMGPPQPWREAGTLMA